MDKISSKRFKNFPLHHNYLAYNNGRIWFLYDDKQIGIRVIRATSQLIHCHACMRNDSLAFNITFVCGFNDASLRKSLWDNLQSIATPHTPWLCLGDLNVVLSSSERLSFATYNSQDSSDLADCLSLCALSNLKVDGCFFTWCNNQTSPRRIYAKLDQILCNATWHSNIKAAASFLPSGISDHSPSAVNLMTKVQIW